MSETGKPIEAGSVHEAPYPFVRDTYTEWSEDGACDYPTWKPGVRMEDISPEDVAGFADGVGRILLTVISVHRPSPRYPTRVFFTRQWVGPDGRKFGRTNCRVTTLTAFRRMAQGYRHPYSVETSEQAAS